MEWRDVLAPVWFAVAAFGGLYVIGKLAEQDRFRQKGLAPFEVGVVLLIVCGALGILAWGKVAPR